MSLRVRIGAWRVLGHGRRAHRRVDGRVDERLVGDVGATLGAEHLGGHGREVAAGRVARETETGVPDAGAGRVGGGPAGGVDAVVGGLGRPVLRGEAVVDVEHGHPGAVGDPGADRVVAARVAEHPPAAVEPQHRGQGLARRRLAVGRCARRRRGRRGRVKLVPPISTAGRDRPGDPREGQPGRREPRSAAGDLVTGEHPWSRRGSGSGRGRGAWCAGACPTSR